MKQIWRSLYLTILPLAILASFTRITTVRAQITPDKSLGAENSVVNPNAAIKGLPSTQIDGGATRGANLFHSFQEFNVDAGRGAYFSNPAGIQNILSRVTGGNPSNILGTLGVLGNANLFFINPNGIIFGPNARLDVGGSFFASTANSLVFPNGFEFSATNPQAPPLLTVNIPIGLRFRDNPGSILNQSPSTDSSSETVGLQVQPGKTLALVGGNVSLDGGSLQAPGGRVELGGLAAVGTVGINSDNSLSFPQGVQRADVSLTNGSYVDVEAASGGSIAVNARNLDVLGKTTIFRDTKEDTFRAGVGQGLKSDGSVAGDITVNATGDISLTGTVFDASGGRGTINIQAGSISLNDYSLLQVSDFGGVAGTISIRANDSISAAKSSIVSAAGFGKSAGDINIQAKSISLTDGSGINVSATEGVAGNIKIQASDSVIISGGNTQINAFGGSSGSTPGVGGNINIRAKSLNLSDGARVDTTLGGEGTAGNVQVNASDAVSISGGAQLRSDTSAQGNAGNITIAGLDGVLPIVTLDGVRLMNNVQQSSGAFSTVEFGAVGKGGDINVTARSLSLSNGAQIDAETAGTGNAGSIFVQANDSLKASNSSQIRSAVENTGVGQGGDVKITTGSLSLTSGAELVASTFGKGDAGNVTINANDTVSLDGVGSNGYSSGAFSTVESGAVGKGGNINVTARSLSLTSGAALSTVTSGQAGQTGRADAGNVQVNTSDAVSISSGAQLRSDTFGQGNAGNITIAGRDGVLPVVTLDGVGLVQQPSGVGSTVGNDPQLGVGNGRGGDITITARSLSLNNGAQIDASTAGTKGQAGNLNITAKTIRLDQGSLTAETASTPANESGANITLQGLDLLFLRNNSLISAKATNDTANGGNITIDAKNGFVVATAGGNNGSDIIANASLGRGGNINITSQSVFGLAKRQAIPGNRTNDIDASSQVDAQQGTVNINSPDVDPSRGLIELPENVVDPTRLIAQNPCLQGTGSAFIITGRGGLPSNPNQALTSDNVRVDLVTPASSRGNSATTTVKPSTTSTVKQIVPAQGWVFNDKGQVVLTAYDPTKTGSQRSWQQPASCAKR